MIGPTLECLQREDILLRGTLWLPALLNLWGKQSKASLIPKIKLLVREACAIQTQASFVFAIICPEVKGISSEKQQNC